jgi:hypothetical protein
MPAESITMEAAVAASTVKAAHVATAAHMTASMTTAAVHCGSGRNRKGEDNKR